MKALKRILATMMCLCLVWGCVAVIGSAEETPTGSITIENQSGTNASVAGKKLNLFKIFEATTDGENISYQWIKEQDGTNRYESFFFGDDTFKNNDGSQKYTDIVGVENGTIHDVVAYINSLHEDSFAFSQMAAKLHSYIHDKGVDEYVYKSDTVPADSTSYTFKELELGYYLIYDATEFTGDTPAVRSAAMLTHSGENKVIKLKADRPHIEKHVDDNDDPNVEDWKLGTTASIGDTVKFRIVTMIPDHDLYGDNYIFAISDTMANELKLVEDSFKVTITQPATVEDDGVVAENDFDYVIYKTVDGTNFTQEEVNAGVDFKVVLNHITELPKDTVVEIIYDAKVLSDAKDKNVNTATLTYSNDPNKSSSTGSVDAKATVMLWQFTLTKYMEDANGTPSFIRLPGAEFEIYNKNDLNNPLKFRTETVEGATYSRYIFDPEEGNVTTLKTLDEGDDGKTDIGYTDGGNLGQILIWGLGEGTYVIRETKAPAGYQIAKGDFEFTVSDTIGITGAISDASISEATRTDAPGKFTRVMIQENSQKYYIGITNAPGSALPETGGMGTTLFTVIGIVLMAGALGFFSTRKRNSMA